MQTSDAPCPSRSLSPHPLHRRIALQLPSPSTSLRRLVPPPPPPPPLAAVIPVPRRGNRPLPPRSHRHLVTQLLHDHHKGSVNLREQDSIPRSGGDALAPSPSASAASLLPLLQPPLHPRPSTAHLEHPTLSLGLASPRWNGPCPIRPWRPTPVSTCSIPRRPMRNGARRQSGRSGAGGICVGGGRRGRGRHRT